jgi:hypothetical protein
VIAMRRFASLASDPARTLRYAWGTRDAIIVPPILSPSVGRVGSTMLWQALVKGRARAILGEYTQSDWLRVSRMCWDLAGQQFKPGTVIKSHDFPYQLEAHGPLKIVFLFGRPSDVVLSVMRCQRTEGDAWIADHLRHLHADGTLEHALDRDVFRIEEQIDAWHAKTGFDILCLNYAGLWENLAALSAFVGYEVTLPEQRERGYDDLDPAVVARVRNNYAQQDEKVAALPHLSHCRA